MVLYNFKKIQAVLPGEEIVDVVLTRTQRKTPTVIHPQYKIQRIRSFYMRKVKFTQQTISERLGQILEDFPRLDEIHPFYADLINVLYDKDHYKLALGQVNLAKRLVESVCRDYVRLLKYGDSLYRCKQLKRAAMGRMCTILKRQKSAFTYLEEVRKHLARLPSLDPNTRTLLVTGYPNVGKSSFVNKVTRANVEVQPYAFTTKSLYVGHMDYRYLRWQVIDTPGVLDHPLDQMNTIEMQAITALAHLPCCVLYFMDLSEECGYTLEQQVGLFRSIRPLFANKQLILVLNKVDIRTFEDLPPSEKALVEHIIKEVGCEVVQTSNVSEQGISEVKTKACDLLLESRVENRLQGKKINAIRNRLTVVNPKPRDTKERKPFIPESVILERKNMIEFPPRKLQREIMIENGGAGMYTPDVSHYYLLENEEWKKDKIPHIIDGKNIADFVDPDIEKKLEALEREEEQLEQERAAIMDDDESDVDVEEQALADAIMEKKAIIVKNRRDDKTQNHPVVSRKRRSLSLSNVQNHLDGLGVESSFVAERRKTKRRKRMDRDDGNDSFMDVDKDGKTTRMSKKASSTNRSVDKEKGVLGSFHIGTISRSPSAPKDKLSFMSQRKMNQQARAGEADRRQYVKKKRHLLAGKGGLGTRRSR